MSTAAPSEELGAREPADGKGPGFMVVAKKEFKASLLKHLRSESETKASRPLTTARTTENDDAAHGKCAGRGGGKVSRRELKGGLEGFVLDNVLSEKECDSLLEGLASDGHKFTFWNPEAPNRKDTRNVDTVEVYDETLASEIWSRVKDNVTKIIEIPQDNDTWEYGLEGTWVACGINPRLLFARYSPGGHFSPHTDGHVVIDFNHRTLHSVIIYLNTCAEGGATHIFHTADMKSKKFVQDSKGRFRFAKDKIADSGIPKAGSMLSFSQHLMHEGEPVGEGCMKYIIRTDVMYKRTPAVCDDSRGIEAYKVFQQASEAEVNPPLHTHPH
uniref:Fe2OG dioxygenase domain-containing protein n=1 Tax=Lotharella globosa TaxID=91324 RepID=A0A7S3YUZ8_9EUKA